MKLSDFTKATDPLNGKTTSVFDVGEIWSKVLGVVLMIVVFAAGQNVANWIGGKLPVDTKIDPVVSRSSAAPGKVIV